MPKQKNKQTNKRKLKLSLVCRLQWIVCGLLFRERKNDKSYLELYEKPTTLVDSIDSIDSIEMTHSRCLAGKAVEYYRAEFFKVLDTVEV